MRLPFHISGMLGFTSKTHGYALVSEKGIQLVFRTAEDIQNAPEEEAESQMITWDNLANFELKQGIMGDTLKLGVHVMFGDDPDGKNDNVIQLELAKRDRELSERFEKIVKDYRTGERKDDVDDVLDDVRDMLDRM